MTAALIRATVPGVAAFTVNDTAPTEGSRAGALTGRIAELDPGREVEAARLDSLSLGLVDTVVAADDATLRAALGALREARARAMATDGASEQLMGWLTAAISFAYWGLERVSPESAASEVAPGTHAWKFIEALEQSEALGSGELRELLGVDETEVSRSGRRLLESGLVRRTKAGRQVSWELTPRGRRLVQRTPRSKLASAGAKKPIAGADFWMAAIRQGFEGAAGDEPATGLRKVDPTRERIIVRTLELHKSKGVRETTYDDIAASVGVPRETVTDYFPTMDELIKGCGRHALASLRVPPPDRAGEIFGGASTEEERTRRLIATLFDVYEDRKSVV